MNTAFIFSILAGLLNAGNDLIFKRSSKCSRNYILSFYLVAAISSTIIALVMASIMGVINNVLIKTNIVYGILIGVLSFFVYMFYILSFTGESTPVPVTIYRLNLIPGVILAVLFLGETLSPVRYIAITVSIFGIILLTGIKPGTKLEIMDLKSLLYSLTACILGGVLNVANKASVIHGADPINIGFWRFFTVCLLTIVYMTVKKSFALKRNTLLPGIISGALLLGSIIATLIAFRTGDVAFVIPIGQVLTIVLVSIISWTVLREEVRRWKLVGILLSILAVILVNL